MNIRVQDRDGQSSEESLSNGCDICCYEMDHSASFPHKYSCDNILEQYKIKLKQAYYELNEKDFLITMLKDQHMKTQNYCKNILAETENLKKKYNAGIQEMDALKGYLQKSGMEIDDKGALDSLLRNELINLNEHNKEILIRIEHVESNVQKLLEVRTEGERSELDPYFKEIQKILTGYFTLLTSKVIENRIILEILKNSVGTGNGCCEKSSGMATQSENDTENRGIKDEDSSNLLRIMKENTGVPENNPFIEASLTEETKDDEGSEVIDVENRIEEESLYMKKIPLTDAIEKKEENSHQSLSDENMLICEGKGFCQKVVEDISASHSGQTVETPSIDANMDVVPIAPSNTEGIMIEEISSEQINDENLSQKENSVINLETDQVKHPSPDMEPKRKFQEIVEQNELIINLNSTVTKLVDRMTDMEKNFQRMKNDIDMFLKFKTHESIKDKVDTSKQIEDLTRHFEDLKQTLISQMNSMKEEQQFIRKCSEKKGGKCGSPKNIEKSSCGISGSCNCKSRESCLKRKLKQTNKTNEDLGLD